MANTSVLLAVIASFALLFGCCGTTAPETPSTGFCPLGTYGGACTNFCEKAKGTGFDPGGDCFAQCTDDVRTQGLGDATACCKESMRAQCTRTCNAMLSNTESEYPGQMDSAEASDFLYGCMAECGGAYGQIGISADSCSLFDASSLAN